MTFALPTRAAGKQLDANSIALTWTGSSLSVWSDDDWLKKFSGKTLEESKEEEGSEPPKVETQEVRLVYAPEEALTPSLLAVLVTLPLLPRGLCCLSCQSPSPPCAVDCPGSLLQPHRQQSGT